MLSELLEKNLAKVQQESVKAPVQNSTPSQETEEFTAPMIGVNAPSFKQIQFYKTLVLGKTLTDEQRTMLKQGLQHLDRNGISRQIQWLSGLPWKPRNVQFYRPAAQKMKIQTGCYAVQHPSGDIRFYEVNIPTEGRWAGFVFLSQLSGENHIPIKGKAERDEVFSLIVKDMVGALKLFGQKIGRCGHCKKQLTDDESRTIGIGPVCRKKMGL